MVGLLWRKVYGRTHSAEGSPKIRFVFVVSMIGCDPSVLGPPLCQNVIEKDINMCLK